jgi:hydrogenase-4 membrane subunit HyfE
LSVSVLPARVQPARLAVWITDRLQLAQAQVPLVLLTSSFFAMLVGLFLMVTRRKAITQS